MDLLTDGAQVYINGSRKTFSLYKTSSAAKHRTADDETLRKALQSALNDDSGQESEGGGVYRYKINNGKGRLVYKIGVSGPNSAAIFHYHWN